MRIFTYVIVLLIIVIGMSFALLNAELVTFNYYIGTAKLPLSLLLVCMLLLGCFLSLLAMTGFYIRMKNENRHLRHRLKLSEKPT
jgi:putative membrane protein